MEDLKESLKQFQGVLIRYAMMILFGVLVSRKVISQEFSDLIFESAVGVAVVSAIPLAAGTWGWTVKRFNVLMARYARRAEPGTAMIEIKKEVLSKNNVLPL